MFDFLKRTIVKKNTSQLSFTCSKSINRNTRKRCETCSKLTIKTPERRRRRSGVFIVNYEHISHLFLVLLLLTLNKKMLVRSRMRDIRIYELIKGK